MLTRKISFLLLFVLMFPSCSERTPFSEKNFVDFYVQLQMIDAQYGKQPILQKEKVDSLMRAHDLNDSLVNSALSWYGEKPERWEKFAAQVQARVDEMRKHYIKPKPR